MFTVGAEPATPLQGVAAGEGSQSGQQRPRENPNLNTVGMKESRRDWGIKLGIN